MKTISDMRLDYIKDICKDYDGCATVKSLKELIDEIVEIASGEYDKEIKNIYK